jgi:hypothetical protein
MDINIKSKINTLSITIFLNRITAGHFEFEQYEHVIERTPQSQIRNRRLIASS